MDVRHDATPISTLPNSKVLNTSQQQRNTHYFTLSPDRLWLRPGVCVRRRRRVSGPRRLPGEGRAAPAAQARGGAAGGDVAAVTAAGGGVRGGSGDRETRGAPTLQDRTWEGSCMHTDDDDDDDGEIMMNTKCICVRVFWIIFSSRNSPDLH